MLEEELSVRPNMEEREDVGLGVVGLYHLLKSDSLEVMERQQSARPEVVEVRKPRDEESLDRNSARHSLKSQVSITSNSEYLAWQNSQLLDSAVSLLEMANCRAKKYYVLAFMDGTIGDGGEADERGKQHHVMFERVTPLMAKDPQGLPTVIFSISLKTLRRNEATIHRSLPQFLDLHRTLLLLHPPSIDADFSFLHTEKLHQLDTKSLAELSRSLLDLLNHLTTVDSVLFSEELHSFLFLKDAADFTPLKPSQVAKADDERRIHPKSSSKSSNRLKFDIVSAQTVVQGDRIFSLYSVQCGQGKDLTIRRRYSQFLALHQQLSVSHHGSHLQGFVFPKKQLTNNFHPDVLETRQSGFKDLLNRIAQSKQLRSSPPVLAFLTKFELEEGRRKFLKGEWLVAAQMFAKVREIRALLGITPSMPLTLVLLASLVEGSNHEVTLPYLEETLADPNLAAHYHLPLLLTGHQLAQSLRMDTRQWVERLAQAGYVKGRSVVSLMELVADDQLLKALL